jgi:hypothetical protein
MVEKWQCPFRQQYVFIFGRHPSQAAGKKIRLLRGDNGFYGERIFQYLEEREGGAIFYIIAARLYKPIQQAIYRQRVWLKLDDGIEIAETEY